MRDSYLKRFHVKFSKHNVEYNNDIGKDNKPVSFEKYAKVDIIIRFYIFKIKIYFGWQGWADFTMDARTRHSCIFNTLICITS